MTLSIKIDISLNTVEGRQYSTNGGSFLNIESQTPRVAHEVEILSIGTALTVGRFEVDGKSQPFLTPTIRTVS